MNTEANPETRKSAMDEARDIFASDRCPSCGNLKRERIDMLCRMCFWDLPKDLQRAIRWKPKGWIVQWLQAMAMLKKARETNA